MFLKGSAENDKNRFFKSNNLGFRSYNKGQYKCIKKTGRARMYIEDGIPVKIKKISKISMDELGHLGYIDYMSKVEIYKEN